MGTDEAVRDLVHRLTPSPSVAIDVEEVRRRVRRRRTRTAVVAAALSVGLVVGGVSIAVTRGAGTDAAPPVVRTPDAGPGLHAGWNRLPRMPLPARWSSLTVWTGEEFLVVGGIRRQYVGGPAPFPNRSDGAAVDPATSTWRRIADAPEAISGYNEHVLVGNTLVIVGTGAWLAYDIRDDEWGRLPAPPARMPQPSLAADPDGARIYAIDKYEVESPGTPVLVLDLATQTWSELPRSPHRPVLDDRSLVATPGGLVAVGNDYHPRQAGPRQQEDAHAEIWNGRSWRRFGDSEVQGRTSWHWTGHRIITTYRTPRVGSDYVRAGALDPGSGEWSRLPWLPRYSNRLLDTARASAEGTLVLSNGYLYDDATGSDLPVMRPSRKLQGSAAELGDGRIGAFGGFRIEPGQEYSRVMNVDATAEAWLYVP